jgi:hypothetical protein
MKNKYYIPVLVLFLALNSCVDKFLPEMLDAYDVKSNFTQTVYRPSLGRTTLMTQNFNFGSSTLPFTFEITNITRADGSPAPELTGYYPVTVWKMPYFGDEKSLSEIESKRTTEYRQLFQVRKHTGEFILWSPANSSFVQCAPMDGYVFDVLSQNSGGYSYMTKMTLIPVRETDFEPSNVDLETGLTTVEYVAPTAVNMVRFADSEGQGGGQIRPGRGNYNSYFMTTEDIHVFFRKNLDIQDDEKTLTLYFYGPDYLPINPDKFNRTPWKSLIHGFEMEKTDQYIRYKVAYPIPLVQTVTDYTNATGDKAQIALNWEYINNDFDGVRLSSSISLDFAIHTEGHWEIIFVFVNGYPMFNNL